MGLRSCTIRLAYTKPELRPFLLPLLKSAGIFNPAQYGLDGLLKGEPTELFHGTTASFTKFDLAYSRDELVNQFYGAGIFLTPSKRVAVRYANANRNMGLPLTVISELLRKNPLAGEFLQELFDYGSGAWGKVMGSHGFQDYGSLTEALGVDGNTLSDIAGHIIGAHNPAESGDQGLFGSSTGSPEWLYNSLEEVGIDSEKYRPKVYTVSAQVKNPLVTASKSEARSARRFGFDCVVFYGSDLVAGVPEVAVFDPRKVRVLRSEVV